MSGPITSDKDTKGISGNVATAIASDKGELRASVVKFSAIISFFENFNSRPVIDQS
ncbi:MAG: hypothetical protein R3Y54_04680 [Eubacteriales bacterium]